MEKGIFTKDVEDLVKKGLDKAIPLTGIKEMVSDAAINFSVPFLDNNLAETLIPEEIKVPIRNAGQYLYDGDKVAASKAFSDAIAQITKHEESEELKAIYQKQLVVLLMAAEYVLKEEIEED